MVQFTTVGVLDAPRTRVWETLADYGNISSWNTGILESGIIAGDEQGVGAVRRCQVSNGMTVEERITHWNEGDGYRLVFDKMPAPVKDVNVTFRLEGDAPTTLSIDYAYKGKGVGVLMAPLMKPMFRKAMKGFVADLKSHVES